VWDWCQFRCPRGLRRESDAARLLWLRVWIPPTSWLSISFECLVLSCIRTFGGLLSPKEVLQDVVCPCVIGKPRQWGVTGPLGDCRAAVGGKRSGRDKIVLFAYSGSCLLLCGRSASWTFFASFLIWLSPVDWLPWVGGRAYVNFTIFPRNHMVGGWPFVLWFIVCLYVSAFGVRPTTAAVREPSDLLPVLRWSFTDARGIFIL